MNDAASRRRINEALTSLNRFANSHQLDVIHAARSGIALSLAAVGVLGRVLDHGPLRLSDLGRLTGMQPAALSRQVRVLEEQGYLSRSGDPEDGRVWVVEVTDAGRKACARVRSANDDLLAAQLEDWSTAELVHLAELMERLDADLRSWRGRRRGTEEDRSGQPSPSLKSKGASSLESISGPA